MYSALTFQQHEQIKKLFWSYAPTKTWMFDEIPARQLASAKKIYGLLNLDHGEIILLHDTTTFGSGKSGYVLSSEALYTNLFIDRPQIFSLADINYIIHIEAKRQNFLRKLASDVVSNIVDDIAGDLVGSFVGGVVDGVAKSFGDDEKVVLELQSGQIFEIEADEYDAIKLLASTWQVLSPEMYSDALIENLDFNWKCKGCGANNQTAFCGHCGHERT